MYELGATLRKPNFAVVVVFLLTFGTFSQHRVRADEFLVAAEYYLHERGVKIDELSLLSAVSASQDAVVRTLAAQVLAEKKISTAAKVIMAAMSVEKNEQTRCAFAGALLKLTGPASYDLARKTLEETKDVAARVQLAAKMARAGSSEGFPVIESALNSASPALQHEAMFALGDFIHPRFREQLDGRPLDLLIETSRIGPKAIRLEAPYVLLRARDNGAQDPRIRATLEHLSKEDIDSEVRDAADICLKVFAFTPRAKASGRCADSPTDPSECPH
jgi:hypothetical protein